MLSDTIGSASWSIALHWTNVLRGFSRLQMNASGCPPCIEVVDSVEISLAIVEGGHFVNIWTLGTISGEQKTKCDARQAASRRVRYAVLYILKISSVSGSHGEIWRKRCANYYALAPPHKRSFFLARRNDT